MEYSNVNGIVLLIKEEIIQKGIMYNKILVARNNFLLNPSENYLNRPRIRSWCKGPKIPNIYASCKFVVSFTLRPYLFWKTVASTPWIVGKKQTRSKLVEKTPAPFGNRNPIVQQCAVTLQAGLAQLGQELILLFCNGPYQKNDNQYYSFRRQSVNLSSVRSWRTCEILSSIHLGR
jgi:hypothetical protein